MTRRRPEGAFGARERINMPSPGSGETTCGTCSGTGATCGGNAVCSTCDGTGRVPR